MSGTELDGDVFMWLVFLWVACCVFSASVGEKGFILFIYFCLTWRASCPSLLMSRDLEQKDEINQTVTITSDFTDFNTK